MQENTRISGKEKYRRRKSARELLRINNPVKYHSQNMSQNAYARVK